MSSSVSDPSDLGPTEYLCYRLIKELVYPEEEPISWSKFWKLSCLADRYLVEESGLDIGFPRHWYKYGETAEIPSVNRDIIQAPSARYWPGQEVLPDREIPDREFEVNEEEKEQILEAVNHTVDQHGDKTVEELKRHQYSRLSPNEFIRTYSHLREIFETVDLDYQELLHNYVGEDEEQYIEEQLNQMMGEFPTEYNEIYDHYLRWDDTMRLMLEHDADAIELKQFLDTFIERLSEIVLRFKHKRNIPEERIEQWNREKQEKIRALEEDINEKRERYLRRRGSSGELERISEVYDDAIERSIENG